MGILIMSKYNSINVILLGFTAWIAQASEFTLDGNW